MVGREVTMKAVVCTLVAIVLASAGAADTARGQTLRVGDRMQNAMQRPGPDQAGPLAAAVSREAARLADERPGGAFATRARASQSGQPSGNWIRRHPVWFGTIVGAVTGAAIVGAAWDSEAAFVGFWGGAAVGAVTGAIIAK